ncbi:MAG: hypothetical protein V4508_16700 [Pseudomonadota bacterium]
MATISSVNSLKIAIALAERQVQRDQSQVQEDASRLDQSQNQLVRDQRQLNSAQEQGRTAQSSVVKAPQPNLDAAIDTKVAPAPAKVQLNAQGQTIGKLINITA